MTQATTELDAANKKIEGHSLIVSNKDTDIIKMREELKEATDREHNAVVEYRNYVDFVSHLANRYNGGWAAAMRCVKHTFPDSDWSQVEEAHGRQDFELPVEGEVLDIGVTEADIANTDPRCEFEEE